MIFESKPGLFESADGSGGRSLLPQGADQEQGRKHFAQMAAILRRCRQEEYDRFYRDYSIFLKEGIISSPEQAEKVDELKLFEFVSNILMYFFGNLSTAVGRNR
jgi:hypothetical protein